MRIHEFEERLVSFSKELQESSQVLGSMETKAEEWQEFAVIAEKDAEERRS